MGVDRQPHASLVHAQHECGSAVRLLAGGGADRLPGGAAAEPLQWGERAHGGAPDGAPSPFPERAGVNRPWPTFSSDRSDIVSQQCFDYLQKTLFKGPHTCDRYAFGLALLCPRLAIKS